MTPRILGRYVGARVAQAVIVLIAAYTVTFLILDALPGNAVDAVTGGQSTDMSPQQLEALKVSFGLNRPVWSQWWLHLSQLFQGNLGRSYITGEPVSTELTANIPASFTAVRVEVTVTGPESAQRYAELATAVDEHCPVLDLFKNPVPVTRELAAAR